MVFHRLLPLLLVPLFCGFMQDKWRLFSPDERFSMEFPREPKLQPAPVGAAKAMTGKTWISAPDQQIYMVAYLGMPGEIPASRQDLYDAHLAKMIEGMLDGNGGEMTLTSEKAMTVETMPAREFEGKIVRKADKITALMRGRIIIARDRVYILCITELEGTVDSAVADRFFNSLKIMKR